MKLVYNKKTDDPSYYIQHSYRVGDKVKTKTVYKIGKHSELAKVFPDPLAYALDVEKKYKQEYQESISSDNEGTRMSNDSSKNRIVKSTSVNIGYLYLQAIYHKLNFGKFFEEVTKDRKMKFDCNQINRFLTFDRIMAPKSKLDTISVLDKYYEKPQFSHQQALRFMDLLAKHYDAFLDHLYKQSNNIIKRDTSVCYYDCSNFYFEIESADDDYLDEITGEIILGLRQYGISKENRPNPIVEMGLFMDKQGIPLTMGIYQGNLNEQKTASPLETKLLKSLEKKEFIYCADAGLGSTAIRTFNSMQGKKFIVTQSMKKLSKETLDKAFKDEGFKLVSNDKPVTLKSLREFDHKDPKNLHLYNDSAYKVLDITSNVDLGLYEEKTLKNGKTRLVKSKTDLVQRVIITYSRKNDEYSKRIRNKQIDRAKNLLARDGVEAKKKGPNDITRFIKNVKDTKNEYELDNEKIKEEEMYDGFYAIATNLMEDKVQDILEINQQRFKIEECFRVLKTNFSARPVYHSLDNRITAHFMICYAALLIYRLLENCLININKPYTINEIIKSINSMDVNLVENKYHSTFTYATIIDALNEVTGIDLKYEKFGYKQIDKILKKIL